MLRPSLGFRAWARFNPIFCHGVEIVISAKSVNVRGIFHALGPQPCLRLGAAPCGLHAAVELRLPGANVTVVERRVHFSRINQLHVWSWVGLDLMSVRVSTESTVCI